MLDTIEQSQKDNQKSYGIVDLKNTNKFKKQTESDSTSNLNMTSLNNTMGQKEF